MRNVIRLTNEMLEDVDCRRRVAKEIFEMLSESANVIRENPAFFEVYIPVKVTLKVSLVPSHPSLNHPLELFESSEEC